MRLALAMFTVAFTAMPGDDGVERKVFYTSATLATDRPAPTFDKGHLIYINHGCEITVHGPTGKLAFSRRLTAPGGQQCSPGGVAVDSDGVIALAIGYPAAEGYSGGILLLDSNGMQMAFIDSKRYIPHEICFDREHAIWSIGRPRDDAANGSPDRQERLLVRKFSRSGKQLGAYMPASIWGPMEPAIGALGYWSIAAANDRIGALVHDRNADYRPEWVEWDLNGKLLSRVPIPRIEGGRAYTAGGRLYAGICDRDGKRCPLQWLDSSTGFWTPVTDLCPDRGGQCGGLMGADGEHLVFRERGGGPIELLWVRPEAGQARGR